jgi:hypothetical protein
MRYFLLPLILALLTAGCVGQQATLGNATVSPAISSEPSPSPPAVQTPRPLDHSIRKVDFLNFTYNWFPEWADNPDKPRAISLKHGKMRIKNPEAHSGIGEFDFHGLSYGDVTGDGVEDALVALFINTTGTQRPFCLLVYTVEGKAPKLLWLHETGGGGNHGLRDYYIEDGHVVIEEYNPVMMVLDGKEVQAMGGRADTYTKVYYGWDGHAFQPVRSQELSNRPGTTFYVGDHEHNEVGESPHAVRRSNRDDR